MTDERKEIDRVRKHNQKDDEQLEDWLNWRFRSVPFNLSIALNLQRDAKRAKIYCMLWTVEHVPGARHYINKFRYTGVGVFKIDEALGIIERILGLKKGTAKKEMESAFRESKLELGDDGPDSVAMVTHDLCQARGEYFSIDIPSP